MEKHASESDSTTTFQKKVFSFQTCHWSFHLLMAHWSFQIDILTLHSIRASSVVALEGRSKKRDGVC